MSLIRICLFLGVWLLGFNNLPAQPQLQAEVDALVDDMVKQLSRRSYIKTIAIVDLTRSDYTPTELGRSLSQELYTSIARHPERQFRVISRQRLDLLLEELEMEEGGYLSPENTPRLGRLPAIDLVIGGTIAPNANKARVNLKGIELETQTLEAATNGRISLTQSLRALDPELVIGDTHVEGAGAPERIASNSPQLKYEQLVFTPQGCRTEGARTRCTYNIISTDGDTNLTVYGSRAKSQGQSISVTGVQLGEARGRGSVTATLYRAKPLLLILSFPANKHPVGKEMSITFLSNRNGRFDFSLPVR